MVDVNVNNSKFSEKKLSEQTLKITNTTNRKYEYGEIVFVSGFYGNVIEREGIMPEMSGLINIGAMRAITSDQIDNTDTYDDGTVNLWANVQTSTERLVLRGSEDAERVKIQAVIISHDTTPGSEYIEILPLSQGFVASAGVEEAPIDGTAYVRQDGSWVSETQAPRIPQLVQLGGAVVSSIGYYVLPTTAIAIPVPSDGTFRVFLDVAFSMDRTNRSFIGQLQVDGIDVGPIFQKEMKDATDIDRFELTRLLTGLTAGQSVSFIFGPEETGPFATVYEGSQISLEERV